MTRSKGSHLPPDSGRGFVYVLKNSSMPGLVKVGITENSIDERIQQLFTTGVPSRFEVALQYEVNARHLRTIEADVHRHLTVLKLHAGKEFFRVEVSKCASIVEKFIFETGDGEFVEHESGRRRLLVEAQAIKAQQERDAKVAHERYQRDIAEREAEVDRRIARLTIDLQRINAKVEKWRALYLKQRSEQAYAESGIFGIRFGDPKSYATDALWKEVCRSCPEAAFPRTNQQFRENEILEKWLDMYLGSSGFELVEYPGTHIAKWHGDRWESTELARRVAASLTGRSAYLAVLEIVPKVGVVDAFNEEERADLIRRGWSRVHYNPLGRYMVPPK